MFDKIRKLFTKRSNKIILTHHISRHYSSDMRHTIRDFISYLLKNKSKYVVMKEEKLLDMKNSLINENRIVYPCRCMEYELIANKFDELAFREIILENLDLLKLTSLDNTNKFEIDLTVKHDEETIVWNMEFAKADEKWFIFRESRTKTNIK